MINQKVQIFFQTCLKYGLPVKATGIIVAQCTGCGVPDCEFVTVRVNGKDFSMSPKTDFTFCSSAGKPHPLTNIFKESISKSEPVIKEKPLDKTEILDKINTKTNDIDRILYALYACEKRKANAKRKI